MRSEQQTTTNKRKERSAQRKLWWQQSADQWSTYLISIGAREVKTSGARVSFCCPFHKDTNPSAAIHPGKGGFKCWSASCGRSESDPIKVIEAIAACSYADALDSFKRFFKLTRSISADDVKDYSQDDKHRKQVKLLAEALHYYACGVWQAQSRPETAKNTVKWLQNRGIDDISIMSSLGMLPRQQALEDAILAVGGTAEDFQAARRLLGTYITAKYMDAVVFIYAKNPSEITAFKIRIPGPEKEIVTVRVDDDEMGAFGVLNAAYIPFYNTEHATQFSVVEGEFDQMAIYKGQVNQGSTDEIFFALGGSGHTGVDFAADLGFSKYRIIGDDDEPGSQYPKQIFKNSTALTGRVFIWPARIINPGQGKIDPDEAIKIHSFASVYAEFLDDKNYVQAPRWCLEQTEKALRAVPKEDVAEIESTAAEWGGLLRNDAERSFFAEEFSKINPQVKSTAILYSVNRASTGPLGFEQRILDWILSRFHPVYTDIDTNTLHLWEKESRCTVHIRLDASAGIATFKTFIPSGSLYLWVKECIGLPGYFPDVESDEAVQSTLDKVEYAIEKSTQRALARAASLAPKSTALTLGQGIHLHDVEYGGPAYIVNGNRVYRFKYGKNGISDCTELDGPSDNGVVFDIRHNDALCSDPAIGWAEFVKTAKDLTRKPVYDLRSCYELTHRIINTLFDFTEQEVDAEICTYLPFYTNLHTVINKYRTAVHILGLYESGKTTLLSLIGNSNQLGEYALTRHAAMMVTFTHAAFFQSYKNTALVAALDEMNDTDDGSYESQQKQMLWASLRTLVTSGKTQKLIGSRTGEPRLYILRNSVFTASATAISHDMDASRIVTIKLDKKHNKENARVLLPQIISLKEIENLRHSIFIHSLQMAPAISQAYKSLYTRFAEEARVTNVATINRSLENIMPIAALAEVINGRGIEFLKKYRVSRQGIAEERKIASKEHAIIDAILNAPIIEVAADSHPRMRSVRSLLLDPDNRELINSSSHGVYFDSQSQCIAIVWDNIARLLTGTPFVKVSRAALKSMADHTEHFIPLQQAVNLGILARLKAAGMAGARLFSIYSVNYIINDFEDALRSVQHAQKTAIQPSENLEI